MTDVQPDEPRTLTEVRAWVLALSISINELREATANTIDALDERITSLEHRESAVMTALEVQRKPGGIDPADIEVLRALGLPPDKVEARALILLARRYDLDPLLKQIELLSIKGVLVPYITRDGMIQIADRSGMLDGLVTEELRRGEHGYSCTFTVYRKDMSHPITYKGGCGHQEMIAKNGYGAEMALARAERRTLIRAFAIQTADEPTRGDVENSPRVDPDVIEVEEVEVPAVADHDTDAAAETSAETSAEPEPEPLVFTQSEAHAAIGALVPAARQEFLAKHGIAEFGSVWPPVALQDAARIAQEPF